MAAVTVCEASVHDAGDDMPAVIGVEFVDLPRKSITPPDFNSLAGAKPPNPEAPVEADDTKNRSLQNPSISESNCEILNIENGRKTQSENVSKTRIMSTDQHWVMLPTTWEERISSLLRQG